MRVIPVLMGVAALIAAAAGCGPSDRTVSGALYLPKGDYLTVFRATAEEVRREGFRLLVEDPETGDIETAYKGGRTVLEPWALQATTVYDAAEDTLHAVRRRAQVKVRPEADGVMVIVQVWRERQGYYQDRAPVYSKALYLFQDEILSPMVFEPHAAPQPRAEIWADLGHDGVMERRLLQRIQRRVARAEEKAAAPPPEPAPAPPPSKKPPQKAPEKTIWDTP